MSVQAKTPREDHWINHLTFRRTISAHERICFETDHYDQHRVTQAQAVGDPYVWRVNLLGGGRLVDLSQRLRRMRTLAKFIGQQKDWDYGEGFIVGHGEIEAPFLTGKKYLPTKALTIDGIDEGSISVIAETNESPRNENWFTPPYDQSQSCPDCFWSKSFIDIEINVRNHAPATESDLVRFITRLS